MSALTYTPLCGPLSVMARHYRRDFGKLGNVERTPQGGMRVEADLTRSGVFTYHTDDGRTIREYRPPSEVGRAETIASLRAAPLTVDHPPVRVSPDNFRQYAAGHVGDDVRWDDFKTTAATYWQDTAAIRAIEGGRREMSCGYHCDVDETPGVVPEGEPDAGKPYDRVQRGILYNHAALVNTGRAGHEIRLRLDSAGDSTEGAHVEKVEIIEGIEYPVGTEPHRGAVERRDSADRARKGAEVALTAERDAAFNARDAEKLRADAAEKKLAETLAEVKDRLSPARMDAMCDARLALREIARDKIGKDFKCDGLSSRAIKIAVINKVSGLRLDAADKEISADYIRGQWDAVVAQKSAPRNDTAEASRGPIPAHLQKPPEGYASTPPHVPSASTSSVQSVRNDAVAEGDARSARPLRLSKQRPAQPSQSAQIETMR